MLPTISCHYCTDGVSEEGTTCGWCNGQSHRAVMCDACKVEYASHWTEMGEAECDVCEATRNRNEAA